MRSILTWGGRKGTARELWAHVRICSESPEGGTFKPRQFSLADFDATQFAIALRAAVHRPLIERRFPEVAQRVTYWHPDDALNLGDQSIALAMIDDHVRGVDFSAPSSRRSRTLKSIIVWGLLALQKNFKGKPSATMKRAQEADTRLNQPQDTRDAIENRASSRIFSRAGTWFPGQMADRWCREPLTWTVCVLGERDRWLIR